VAYYTELISIVLANGVKVLLEQGSANTETVILNLGMVTNIIAQGVPG
jgi:uncharacterized protein YejL (UPF0352 family)